MQDGKGGRFGPLHHLPHMSPPASANETIDNPQSIHVLVDVRGKMGGRGTGGGRGESGRRRERNGGKLRNNGQYSVIEKKRDKVKKSGGGFRDCKVREAGVPPPSPTAPPLPHYCIMLIAT